MRSYQPEFQISPFTTQKTEKLNLYIISKENNFRPKDTAACQINIKIH